MKTGSNVSNVVPERGAQKETTLFPSPAKQMIIRLIIECKVISPRNFFPLENYQPRGARQR
ncbi:hypothetical protein SMQE01_20010 [Serratia marcescens]|jgi:hypothetical protein|nr:hypothetical protein SMQE01_20010 [Serratia marcescens]